MKRFFAYGLVMLAIGGLLDSLYLSYEHINQFIPPCSANILLADCGSVLRSEYSTMFGVPLAFLGVFHYSVVTIVLLAALYSKKRVIEVLLLGLATLGFSFSSYFVYLQLVIIQAICLYCMISALSSTLLVIGSFSFFYKARIAVSTTIVYWLYKYIGKPIFFLIDPLIIHETMTRSGEILGSFSLTKNSVSALLRFDDPMLLQDIEGITFKTPIGLAAGFDYEARLTQITPSLGFGFQSVGTITYGSYQGNPAPMLGRLPKSQSLMVNKGFKNGGATAIVNKLKHKNFEIPVGISIGQTNTKRLTTHKEAIEDIVKAFMVFETSTVNHSYYELNISCPNLQSSISFYDPKRLKQLLHEIDKLQLVHPLFIKMPIDRTNQETLELLDIVARHSAAGVIFGNLQKDRKHPSLDVFEVSQFPVGNFSGRPTFDRSNELIALCYKHFSNRLDIIGCGGVFSAKDAYKKITLGASLIQLITGMIFVGPQLIADINLHLVDLLKQDGFRHISEAIGSNKRYGK